MTERSAPPAITAFIERYAILSELDGLPRTAGRMLALMIVDEGPFSFAALAERLQVSRGSVSTNTRLLEQLGFIERTSRPGDRQDYYQLAADPWQRTVAGWIERQGKKQQVIDALLDDAGDLSPGARRRAAALLRLMQATTEQARSLLERLQQEGN